MELIDSLARFAGRLLRPVRSGERKLAHHQLGVEARTISVASDSFGDGAPLPDACAGSDGRSPELHFSDLPGGTRELVLLAEDPDAPFPRPFVHWIVFGIAPDVTELPEGLPPVAAPLSLRVHQGRNSLRKDGYLGPTPPPGHGVHHYHFQLFALNAPLDVRAPVDRSRLLRAMKHHIIGFGELIGTYEKR